REEDRLGEEAASQQPSAEVPPTATHESKQPSAEVPPTATQQPSEFSSPPTVPSTEPRTHSYDGDPEAEHKMCIKYASDEYSDSDDETSVNLFAVVDWELLPTGLGSINVFYKKDNSRKCFSSLREILHLVTRADL
ncbi:hypothetical protein Tco_0380708, partial [Tanacetum coccineum]